MKKTHLFIGLSLALPVFLGSCKKDKDPDPIPELNVADTYDSTGYAANPLNTAAKSLVDREKAFPTNRPSSGSTVKVTAESLKAEYSVGTPSAWSIASDTFKSRLENVYFPMYETNSGVLANDSTVIDWSNLSATPNGGTSGGYIFNNQGVEIEQVIMKGGFGGISFNYVKNTLFKSPREVTQEQLNSAIALYGSNATFEQKDQSAKYTKDRDYSTVKYHDAIHREFRKVQAAVKENRPADKEKAINQILLLWEEGLMAQVIYYTYDVIDYFSKTTITDTDKAKGCHAWSETVGIVSGFGNVAGKKITEEQITSYLNAMKANANGTGTPTDLIGNATELAKVQTAIDNIAAIYPIDKTRHKRN